MVDRITAAELKALQDSDAEFTLVDTRSEEDYRAFHVRGARNFQVSPDVGPSDEEIRSAFDDVDEDERYHLALDRIPRAIPRIFDTVGTRRLASGGGGLAVSPAG